MSKVVLYGIDISPPVRACLLTLHALEVPFDYKIVNLLKGEHMTEEFLKHNPQHTVPVLEDNGTWIWDSHAICAYLADKYGKTDSMYPKDLAKRAIVNQRLFFDASVLFMSLGNISKPFFRQQVTEVPKEKVQSVLESFGHLENFLGDNPYLTGEHATIADFSCVATASSLRDLVKLDGAKYPKVTAWIERLSKLPFYEKANGKGNKEYIGILSKLNIPSV